MSSKKQTPVWPYLIVLTCLFVLSVTAPRAWEEKVPKPAVVDRPGTVEAGDEGMTEAPSLAASHDPPGSKCEPSATAQSDLPELPLTELAPPFANQVVAPELEVAHRTTSPAILPEMNMPGQQPQARVQPTEEPVWRSPATLLSQLGELLKIAECAPWAARVQELLAQLEERIQLDDGTVRDSLAELRRAAEEGARLAQSLKDPSATSLVLRAQYALARRLDVWDLVPGLGLPGSLQDGAINSSLARRAVESAPAMTKCLAQIADLTAKESKGAAWREYLLLDRLQSTSGPKAASDDEKRQLAQQVLLRLAKARRSAPQRKFLDEGPLAALGEELHRWSVEPMDARQALADIEQFETARSAASARQVAADWRSLHWSAAAEDQQLATRIDAHYRNANVRVAVAGSLVNRFVQQPAAISEPVYDFIAGADVRGCSTTFTTLSVRLLPDPRQLRLGFEASGLVQSDTAASSGPATIYSAGQSGFLVRKLAVVNHQGLRYRPAVAEAEHYYHDLQSVETAYDYLPLVGPWVRSMARSQHDELLPQAQAETQDRMATRAREQFDAQIEPRLRKARQEFDRRVLSPMARLSLDLTPVELATTEDRLVARLRVAGEDQLGAHTPRPRALSDSLASFQLHESALNNAVEHLDLAGRTFTIAELMKWITERMSLTAVAAPEDVPDDVVITFAGDGPVRLRCEQGRMELTLSVAELTQGRNRWHDFIVRAFYVPEIASPQARLIREGGIQLDGESIRGKPELLLRGIFSKALSKSRPWILMDQKLVNDPRFRDLEVTQFTLEDGWIGIAYAAKRVPSSTAKRNATIRK